MVWFLALCPGDTKQDSVVYGAEFGVVFLAKGPRTASIQEGLDCLRLNHSGLEGERDFRLVVELPTPAGTFNKLDVQNEWQENTHTHTQVFVTSIIDPPLGGSTRVA